MAHETALLPPARDLAVESIEEEAKGQEVKSKPDVSMGSRVDIEAVAQRGEDGHDAAEAFFILSAVPALQMYMGAV